MPSSPGVYDLGGGIIVHVPSLTPAGEGTLTALGWESEIVFKVEGLLGKGFAFRSTAVAAVQSTGFTLGVTLTAEPGATLQAYRVRPVSKGVAEVRCVFRAVGVPQNGGDSVVRITNSAVQFQTNKGVNGGLLKVTHNSDAQVKTVGIMRPQPVVEVIRQESGYPTIASQLYVGTVNNGPCPWDPAAPLRSWLCIDISAESRDLLTWSKSYRFQYAIPKSVSPFIGGWDEVIAYTNPSSGSSPSDLSTTIYFEDSTKDNVGYQVYPSQNFMVFAFLF